MIDESQQVSFERMIDIEAAMADDVEDDAPAGYSGTIKRLLSKPIGSYDIHKEKAAMLFGVPYDEVTPEQRDTAKTINYGVLYGVVNGRV
jgi:DNA polymerase-1